MRRKDKGSTAESDAPTKSADPEFDVEPGDGVRLIASNPDTVQSDVDAAIAEGFRVLYYSDSEGMQRTDVFGVQ